MTHLAKTSALLTALAIIMSALLAAPNAAAHSNADTKLATATHEIVRGAVKHTLAKRRALQIARLEGYLRDGVFPRNRVSDQVTNIFRDEDGLLCAIAYLIESDGLKSLVNDTAKTNNQVKIGTLTEGGLFQWVLASGLTQSEIAMVQLPDSPIVRDREWSKLEDVLISTHLTNAIKMLNDNTDASLELATDRVLERFAAAAMASS